MKNPGRVGYPFTAIGIAFVAIGISGQHTFIYRQRQRVRTPTRLSAAQVLV
jgi:hypothetical protein